ncbi:MAG: DUF4386 domain-containing protein [Micrococcales bacterium]|nr:DUF4386 domain-containing protein [Micrococcales bacterium]
MNMAVHTDPHRAGITRRGFAIVAAVGLLTTMVVAPIAFFGLLPPILEGDGATTLTTVATSEQQLRVAIVLLTLNAIADIVVFWALYHFLQPAGRALSHLALLFGLMHVVVMAVAVTNLVDLLHMATSGLPSETLEGPAATAAAAFTWAWQAGMVMFGVHLLLRGWLLFTAGYLKKVLGITMWVVAVGYLVDAFGQMLIATYTTAWVSNSVGWLEVVLPLWLVWVSTRPRTRAAEEST